MTSWLPEITRNAGPKYLAIADAIAKAIADGDLDSGVKLPPQRNLAYDLGVTLGTVTRAYREAERRGLVGGEVGRGTYVLGDTPRQPDGLFASLTEAPGIIDFTHATPVEGVAGRELAKTLKEIAADPNIDALANYHFQNGLSTHLEAGAYWLAQNGLKGTSDNVAMTNGVQHGLLVSIMALMSPGDTILLEELTYPGVLNLTRTFGYRTDSIRIDEHGLIPEALDEACRRTSARVLYCVPTLHNPTVAIMPEERRVKIAEIAKRHSLLIIEDDVWGRMIDIDLPHFANLLPEQTVYLSSLSKNMAGGLRIGYAFAPPRITERLRAAIKMTCCMPAPLMAEVARRWIYSDIGNELLAHQHVEIAARCSIALERMKPYNLQYNNGGYYFWLHMPEQWQAADFRSRAEDRGLRFLSAQTFAVHRQSAPEAVRIGLGRPETIEQVKKGLDILVDLLEGSPDNHEPFI